MKEVKLLKVDTPVILTPSNVPNVFASLRKSSGYTARELGKKLGVTDVTIYNWEHGFNNPSFPFLISILNFYGYDLVLTKKGERGNESKKKV